MLVASSQQSLEKEKKNCSAEEPHKVLKWKLWCSFDSR